MPGSVRDINLAGRTFAVAADSDGNIDLGGFNSESQVNGNRTTRKVLTAMPWSVADLNISLDPDRNDQQYIQNIVNQAKDVPFSVTLVDGKVYQGSGLPEGEIKWSTQTGTAPIGFAGPGELTLQ